jgi:hypothetical protein
MDAAAHWHRIFTKAGPEGSSWFTHLPNQSLQLVKKYAPNPRTDAVIDAGGGASVLAELLLKSGYGKVTITDYAPAALDWTYRRLGTAAERYRWVCADVTKADLGGPHRLWHDRGCFHFLPDAAAHRAYAQAVRRHLVVSGHVVLGTYARGGPKRASGLAVLQFNQTAIEQAFGPEFRVVDTAHERIETMSGRAEPYLYAVLRRMR